MPADVAFSEDGLELKLGRRRISLTPSEGFALAEKIIRGATRAIVQGEADRVIVVAVVQDAGPLQ